MKSIMTANLAGEMMDTCWIDAHGERFLSPGESITSTDGTVRLTNVLNTGPQLMLKNLQTDEWGEPVWTALDKPLGGGVLCMEGDGNVVFRSASNSTLWESGTSQKESSCSRLVITGQKHPGGASLFVYNYALDKVTCVLYP